MELFNIGADRLGVRSTSSDHLSSLAVLFRLNSIFEVCDACINYLFSFNFIF